jgi:selenophosphate synthetase-related protein
MTTDDTLTLRQWLKVFKEGFMYVRDEEGVLMAVALLPLFPLFAAVAAAVAERQKIDSNDTEKIQAAKERDIEDWSELKSR